MLSPMVGFGALFHCMRLSLRQSERKCERRLLTSKYRSRRLIVASSTTVPRVATTSRGHVVQYWFCTSK